MVNLAKTLEVVPGRPLMALLLQKILRQKTKFVNITHPYTNSSILLRPRLPRANKCSAVSEDTKEDASSQFVASNGSAKAGGMGDVDWPATIHIKDRQLLFLFRNVKVQSRQESNRIRRTESRRLIWQPWRGHLEIGKHCFLIS
jgi:hypothetical protein